jgi:hypothetical protein
MRTQRFLTSPKRWALYVLIGLAMQSTQSAHGQLVGTDIVDATSVVQAQATASQAAAPTPIPQVPLQGSGSAPPATTPQTPAVPALPGVQPPASSTAVPPTINPAFSDPLVPPPTLTPPSSLNAAARNSGALNFGAGAAGLGLAASIGATADSFASSPTMIGDLFGGGVSIVSSPKPVTFSFHSIGTIISGTGNSTELVFEFGTGTPNDIFTVAGSGVDVSGDGQIDQFSILEPIPPTDAPTSPGPGFRFVGGEAVYTDDNVNREPVNGSFTNGDFWFVKYTYESDLFANGNQNILIAGPDVATRRTKLSENFSPEVRDRCFLSYSFFNDAFGGLGDVSRYVLGFEKVLIDDLMSFEVRLPMAGTYSSRQRVEQPGERDFELGNATLVSKFVLLRSDKFTMTGGTGISVPFADDARLLRGTDELLRIENEAVHILPFTGILYRYDQLTTFQAYTQFDVDMQGNPVLANLDGGPLRGIGRFTDSTIGHADISAHRMVYDQRRTNSKLKGVIANAELHYTGTLRESDSVAGEGVVVTNLKKNFNIVNGTVGAHLLVGNNVVITPAMSVPLRDGLDEQFDYEAILQLNYLH